MYRIQEEQIEDKTIYTLQEGYVRKFKPMNGFGIAKEVVWMTRVRTSEFELATEAYKLAQKMSFEDFKSYAKDKIHQIGIKKVADKTILDQAAFDHRQLEAKMSEMITDYQLQAKKYKELKEIVAETIRMINQGAILQPNSLLVLALNEGIK
jgi:hypothetical protein